MAFHDYKSGNFYAETLKRPFVSIFLKETKAQFSELLTYPNLFAQAKFQRYAQVVGTVKSILMCQRIHSMGSQHFVERRKTKNKILYRKK